MKLWKQKHNHVYVSLCHSIMCIWIKWSLSGEVSRKKEQIFNHKAARPCLLVFCPDCSCISCVDWLTPHHICSNTVMYSWDCKFLLIKKSKAWYIHSGFKNLCIWSWRTYIFISGSWKMMQPWRIWRDLTQTPMESNILLMIVTITCSN